MAVIAASTVPDNLPECRVITNRILPDVARVCIAVPVITIIGRPVIATIKCPTVAVIERLAETGAHLV